MRLAARRLRSLLASGRSLVDDGAADDVRDELRWLSRALGAARDPAVVQGRLKELLASEPRGLADGPAAARISRELEATSAAGFEGALTALGSERYTLLLAGLEELVAAATLSDKASRPPRRIFRKLVSKDEARLRRAVGTLAAHGTPAAGTPGARHLRRPRPRPARCPEGGQAVGAPPGRAPGARADSRRSAVRTGGERSDRAARELVQQCPR